jgi:hypothetical protein
MLIKKEYFAKIVIFFVSSKKIAENLKKNMPVCPKRADIFPMPALFYLLSFLPFLGL